LSFDAYPSWDKTPSLYNAGYVTPTNGDLIRKPKHTKFNMIKLPHWLDLNRFNIFNMIYQTGGSVWEVNGSNMNSTDPLMNGDPLVPWVPCSDSCRAWIFRPSGGTASVTGWWCLRIASWDVGSCYNKWWYLVLNGDKWWDMVIWWDILLPITCYLMLSSSSVANKTIKTSSSGRYSFMTRLQDVDELHPIIIHYHYNIY
jgi:hypothetical protein